MAHEFLVVHPEDNYHLCYVGPDLQQAITWAKEGLVVYGPNPQDHQEEMALLQQDRDKVARMCVEFEDALGETQVSNGKLHQANAALRRENEALRYDVAQYRRQLGLDK